MEFACTHVVCNWNPDGGTAGAVPPPLPPRRLKKPRPTSAPPSFQSLLHPSSVPPPVPPRCEKLEVEGFLSANINVVSLSVGKLVDISQAADLIKFNNAVNCGKCSAALSSLSVVERNVWRCEFCGSKNFIDDTVMRSHVGQRTGERSEEIYLPNQSDDDYQNLEDTVVVFCVDTSGSMSVTTEVVSSEGSSTYVSRLESIQDALQRALSSLLQHAPRRRVALVTFSDEVVIYGDGTSTPVTLRDWALIDYDHIWEQGVAYRIPHCIAETYPQLTERVKELKDDGATSLGPAVLASVAMASKYPGSKVILCTDGRANVGLGDMEQTPSSSSSSLICPYFYTQLAVQAVQSGVIVSVITFEGTNCCLAEVGRLADVTGGRVNSVNIGTVATEIQSSSMDNALATGATATLFAPDGVYFPFEDESCHRVVKEIGNVTDGLEITVQFAVKPEFTEVFLQKFKVPFQLQLSFKTTDQQRASRIITEQRPVTTCSQIWAGSLNMAVLGVHCAQLCASLTMAGQVKEAQRNLKMQQDLLKHISKQRPIQKEESIYGKWMATMTTICNDITSESQVLSDEAAKILYQMKRARSTNKNVKTESQIQTYRM
ncbi:circularly permutated Ras protein 1 isoform X2 [Thalassophryne amazonica]|uniref:circularly permutated Ras protein 1 isoform X2 n=1 Tax=Thalassophryne amazonica TaxID=390379 RepID=UPI001470D413|nr:circularly permutated Ras protein 1 isoform X2 [Thalassophryne amazonica]